MYNILFIYIPDDWIFDRYLVLWFLLFFPFFFVLVSIMSWWWNGRFKLKWIDDCAPICQKNNSKLNCKWNSMTFDIISFLLHWFYLSFTIFLCLCGRWLCPAFEWNDKKCSCTMMIATVDIKFYLSEFEQYKGFHFFILFFVEVHCWITNHWKRSDFYMRFHSKAHTPTLTYIKIDTITTEHLFNVNLLTVICLDPSICIHK